MNKHWKSAALMLTTALVAITVASAQGPGPGPGGQRPPMSPAARAKMDAWRTWREKHHNVGQVGRLIRGLVRIESDPTTKLSHTQAKNVLIILSRWQTKPVMTDAQAVVVHHQIMSKLSVAQRAAVVPPLRRGGFGGPGGPGGPPPPGGGRREGGPRAGGGPPGGGPPGGMGGGRGFGGGDPATMPAPHDYSPLNPSTMPIPPMRARSQHDLDELMAMLKAS